VRAVRTADGTRLHAEIFGPDDAPTIVLVHGWVCDLTFWHYQIRDLSQQFRVVAYDQRGHGQSEVPQGEDWYTAETLASDLQAVLDECCAGAEPCIVAGHSMGGMTILAWAGHYPREVRRRLSGALLINTAASQLMGRLLVLGPLLGSRLQQMVLPPLVGSRHTRLWKQLEPVGFRVIRRIVATGGTSPGKTAFLHQMVLSCPAPVRAGFGRLFTTLDLREFMADLTVPTVVISGEHDRLLPPWHSEQLAEHLSDCIEHATLQGIGHMAPVEAPGEISDRIRRLAERARRPAEQRQAAHAGSPR
jgi:pimeloyl-ACP methyl ester carboxylesterase